MIFAQTVIMLNRRISYTSSPQTQVGFVLWSSHRYTHGFYFDVGLQWNRGRLIEEAVLLAVVWWTMIHKVFNNMHQGLSIMPCMAVMVAYAYSYATIQSNTSYTMHCQLWLNWLYRRHEYCACLETPATRAVTDCSIQPAIGHIV